MLKYVKKLLTFGESFVVLLPDANEHRSKLKDLLKAKVNEMKGYGVYARHLKKKST